MKRRLIGLMTAVILCVCIEHAAAGSLVVVTKETQAKLGLVFKLTAVRLPNEAVLVRIEIPKEGKLKDLRNVHLRIGREKPVLEANLETRPGKKGDSIVVSYRLSADLADQCSIALMTGSDDLSSPLHVIYLIDLKDYVIEHKDHVAED